MPPTSPVGNGPLSLEDLDERLSRPTEGVVRQFQDVEGDLIILGAGGKMGPSLATMARRAAELSGRPRRVIAVARFNDTAAEGRLRAAGVETIRSDLMVDGAIDALPDARNVVSMVGMKFGSSDDLPRTWAVNCWLPSRIAERYRSSRLVVFSTGNVYGPTSVAGRGSREGDEPRPVGEYAMSCLGRERLIEHMSVNDGIPVVLLRLNYAVEMRYGVLVDVASRVLQGEPIDLRVGHANVIWQGDANAIALQSLALATSPPTILNLTGPELVRIRDLAQQFGRILGKSPRFVGEEGAEAILNDASACHRRLGLPSVKLEQLVRWTADWLSSGMPTSGKPTRFEVADGSF